MVMLLIAIGVLSSIGLAVYQGIGAWMKRRAIEQSIAWQEERWQRVQQGWLPTLWDKGATDEEKADAILRYARGEHLEK